VKPENSYELGAQMTYALVKEWLEKVPERPRFLFPPKDVALIADLRDLPMKLAGNDSAQQLVDHLIETVVAVTRNAPTAMMLRVVLEELSPDSIEWVSLEELGLKGVRTE
jgi:hypothetical protein